MEPPSSIPTGIVTGRELNWYNSKKEKWLGGGGFGEVYKFNTSSGEVAVKIADFTELGTNPSLLREVSLLMGIRHPYIVPMLDFFFLGKTMGIVLPLANGNLAKYKNGTLLDIFEIKSIFLQIIIAVFYLHSFNIIHGDIKLENILIQPTTREGIGQIWVTDFGLSIPDDCQDNGNYATTSDYIDPKVTIQSDVSALGQLLLNLVRRNYTYIRKIDLPIDVRRIFDSMTRENPRQRINLSAVINDPWFNDVRGTLVETPRYASSNCYYSLIRDEIPLPVSPFLDRYNLEVFYPYLLTGIKDGLGISDRTISLVIAFFESCIYRMNPPESELSLYFQAIISLIIQIVDLNINKNIEKYLLKWITDKPEVTKIKRDICSFSTYIGDKHFGRNPNVLSWKYYPGLDYFCATCYDFLLNLAATRSTQVRQISMTILNLSYHTRISRYYKPNSLAKLYLYLADRITGISPASGIPGNLKQVFLDLASELKQIPNISLLNYCHRGGPDVGYVWQEAIRILEGK